MRFKRRRGFTFVEILLVVVIIGILASMVLPRFVGRSEEARKAVANADINAGIATALDMYELDNGEYPATLDELMDKKYLKKIPKDPWGRAYFYKPAPDKKDYDLMTYGKDGVAGGGDDISNKDTAGSTE